ncbi:hypothetical protein AHAS_Ahas03G0112600 [Arachis hypogaea]
MCSRPHVGAYAGFANVSGFMLWADSARLYQERDLNLQSLILKLAKDNDAVSPWEGRRARLFAKCSERRMIRSLSLPRWPPLLLPRSAAKPGNHPTLSMGMRLNLPTIDDPSNGHHGKGIQKNNA